MYFRRFVLVTFLIILLTGVCGTTAYFCFHSSGSNYLRMEGLNKEPKNTLDVIVIGDSIVHNSFAPGLAYRESGNGVTFFDYSTSFLTNNLWRVMTKNIYDIQNPKLVVVDVHGAMNNLAENTDDYPVHYIFDSISDNLNKKEELDYIYGERKYDLSSFEYPQWFYRSIKSITMENINETLCINRVNFLPLKGAISYTALYLNGGSFNGFPKTDQKRITIESESERYLRDYCIYCRDNQIPVLFINIPDLNEDTSAKADYIGDIVKSYGFDYANFQFDVEKMGITDVNDFRDETHMSIYGQQKFTKYFTKYLCDKYNLQHTELTDAERLNWEYAAKSYDLFYAYADEKCKNQIVEELYDSPAFIRYLTDNLGSEGLIK